MKKKILVVANQTLGQKLLDLVREVARGRHPVRARDEPAPARPGHLRRGGAPCRRGAAQPGAPVHVPGGHRPRGRGGRRGPVHRRDGRRRHPAAGRDHRLHAAADRVRLAAARPRGAPGGSVGPAGPPRGDRPRPRGPASTSLVVANRTLAEAGLLEHLKEGGRQGAPVRRRRAAGARPGPRRGRGARAAARDAEGLPRGRAAVLGDDRQPQPTRRR